MLLSKNFFYFLTIKNYKEVHPSSYINYRLTDSNGINNDLFLAYNY